MQMKRELESEVERHFTRLVCRKKMDSFPRLTGARKIFHHHDPENMRKLEKQDESKTTEIKEHNCYYQQFRPMIFCLTAFGRIAIQRNHDGEYKWKWVSWLSLYCVVNYAVQTYLAVRICQRRIKDVMESSDYDEFIFTIHILAYIQIHFHVPISYWIQGPQYAHYLNEWTRFQNEWLMVLGEELQLNHKRASRVFVLIVLPSLALMLIMEKFSTLHDPYELLLPHFFTIGSTACVLGTWYISCLEVGTISKVLAEKLIKSLQGSPTPEFLQQWRNLWVSLGSLATDLGTNHFAIMTSIFLTFSITFILGLYNAFSKIIESDFTMKTFGYLIASGMSILIIYIVCDSGHQATSRVGSFTSQCILKSQLPATNGDIKYEMDLIFKVTQNPPQIHLAGFVALNRPLFISFLANTFTYLIVILQFKHD